MNYDDAITDAKTQWFSDELIDTVTYNGNSIPAHVQYEENLEQTGANDSVMAKSILTIKQSDVAAPAYRDTVIIGTDTWRVLNIKSGDSGYVWILNLYRDERPVI